MIRKILRLLGSPPYSTLHRLERESLVERIVEGEGADRKIFRITVRGRSKLGDWLLRPAPRLPVPRT